MQSRRTWDRTHKYYFSLIPSMLRGLAGRMLIWIVCISATAALIATSAQLFFDYRRDVSDLEQGMHYIEQNQLPGLADATWNFNIASMQVQLDGIGRSPWVAGATIRYGPNQSAVLTTGQGAVDTDQAYKFTLQRHDVVVGVIYIAPNLNTLYARTIDRIAIVLAAQSAKSLVTSICILLLISCMFTRHLTQMAEFAKSFDPGKNFTPFVLRRGPRAPQDELTVLVDGLNDAYARLQKGHEFEVRHNEILSQEVAMRMAELREAHQKLARQAITDKLTGTLNRFGLDDRFKAEIACADPDSAPLAVILVDIDHFKEVNDGWGHLVGDKLLQEFAAILAANVRSDDTLARWGGEEFLILCPQTSLVQALQLAEQMRASVQKHTFSDVGSKTFSLGVAAFRRGDSIDGLVRRADDALYRAKAKGRNQVCAEVPPD